MSVHENFKRLFSVCLLGLAMVSCGRENRIYSDANDQDPKVIVDDVAHLPDGFRDLSVNGAVVDVAMDSNSSESPTPFIRFETKAGSSDPGGFNGMGTGNRAILGVSRFDELPLSQLFMDEGLSVDAKSITGTERLKVALLTDLYCDFHSMRTIVANTNSDHFSNLESTKMNRYAITAEANIWQTSGLELSDPNDPQVILLPSSSSNTRSSLDLLLLRFPDACVRNYRYLEDDLPKEMNLPGILIALGDASTATLNQVSLKRISFGKVVFENFKWSAP